MSRLFGPTRQLGLVVRDFDRALAEWTTVRGVGPFFFFGGMPIADYRYRGAAAEPPVVSIAFGYSGDLQIEIIHQENDAPSCYLDFLAAGREGVHHVSGFADRPCFDACYAGARGVGLATLHEGAIGGVRFAYFDTEAGPGGIICEISESDMDGPRQLFAGMREAAAAWDGRDPLRPLAVG